MSAWGHLSVVGMAGSLGPTAVFRVFRVSRAGEPADSRVAVMTRDQDIDFLTPTEARIFAMHLAALADEAEGLA